MTKINLEVSLWFQEKIEAFAQRFVQDIILATLIEEYGDGYCSVHIESMDDNYFFMSWIYTDLPCERRVVGNGAVEIKESIKAYLGIENSLSYDPSFIAIER